VTREEVRVYGYTISKQASGPASTLVPGGLSTAAGISHRSGAAADEATPQCRMRCPSAAMPVSTTTRKCVPLCCTRTRTECAIA
jgi:hypothetical protein